LLKLKRCLFLNVLLFLPNQAGLFYKLIQRRVIMRFNRHSPLSFKMLAFVIFAIINLLIAPVPAGAVTGFTKKATLQSSTPLTGCGPDIFLPLGVVSQDTIIGGVTCDESSGQQEGGSVLVFEKPGTGWAGTLVQQQILYPTDPAADGRFGINVDIDGDTMVVGSQRSGQNILGSVYVFTQSSPAGSWQQAARLNATDGENSWGWNPKIDGDVVIAGDSNTGDGTRPGIVYVFVKPGGGWAGDLNETARLVPSTTSTTPIRFGTSTDIAGSVIAVGARSDGGGRGGGYVFVEPPGGWSGTLTEDAILTPSVTTLQLGDYRGVVTDGDTVVLRPTSSFSTNTGLYFYQKSASGWSGTLTETARKQVWGDMDLDAGTLIVNPARSGDFDAPVLIFEKPASGVWTSTSFTPDSFFHPTSGQFVDASLDGHTAVIGQYVYVSSVPTSPVLTVTKGDTPDPVVVNGDLTYTVSVKNNGPGSVTGVTATDTLPAGVAYIGSSPADACTVDSIVSGVTTVTCTLRDLLETELTSVQLNVTAPAVIGTVRNTVSVEAIEISTPVIATEDTQVVDAAADLEILLFTHDPEPVFANSTLSYSVDVMNNGPSDAPAVTVTVGLPSDTTLIDATARNALGQTIVGACSQVRESVVCDMGTVGAGDAVEVDVDVTAPNTAGIITNTAQVTSAVADPGPSPNTATDQAMVVLSGIDLTDSINAPDDFLLDFGTVDVGSSVAGSIALTNNRASSVDVGLISTLDPPFSVINPENCTGPPVDPGVRCVITVQFAPTAGDVNGSLVQGFDLDIGSNGASFLITGTAVQSEADLNITFFSRPSVSQPNITQYDIHIKNEGPDDAEEFYMNLDLPVQAALPNLSSGDPIGDLLVCTDTVINVATGEHRFHCELPLGEVFPSGETTNLAVGINRSGTLGPATLTVGAATDDPDLSNNTRDIDVPATENNGSGAFDLGCFPTIDDTSSPQSRWPDGALLVGMMSLLLWGWSRARRRTIRVRR
jgi:uncharacterized repeat protein (TIGR01451 family)